MKKRKYILTVMVLLAFSLTLCSFSVLALDKSECLPMKQVKEIAGMKQVKEIAGRIMKDCRSDFGLLSFERKQLFDDVYEYDMVFKVGEGEYDKIGIHRVVKERKPYIPIRTNDAVMLLHGDTANFNTAFLPSSANKPVEQSLAAFLAKNGADVWGIDLRWTFIPDNETDFTFMKNWNTAFHLKDIKCAVKFARLYRSITCFSRSKIVMLGHSRGAYYAFAYANMETQIPRMLRDVKGIIPIDLILKLAPENEQMKQAANVRYQLLKETYESGKYYDNEGASLKYVASMAKNAPNEMSTIIPYLTNKQVSILLLSATYATFEPPVEPFTPYYHFNAGTFDENGVPTGLQFANIDYLIDIALSTPSFQSIAEIMECEGIISEAVDLPYDDYLNEIKIPVYYVGAAGGEGKFGQYILNLLGSKDKKALVVELYPPEYAMLDYGHADPIWADNAQTLVWEPILKWIVKH